MKILVVEHAESETAGLVGEALGAIEVCRPWRGQRVPEEPVHDALVVLGGPMAAWDDEAHPHLAAEARLLAASAKAGLPTLGICLGAQLLARGLGARNFRGPTLERGLFPITLSEAGRTDRLLGGFDGATVLHWHEDSFDLPSGAERLASSALYANQAFRVLDNAWGVQFHVECSRRLRLDWDPSWAGDDDLDLRGRAFAERFAALVFSSPGR